MAQASYASACEHAPDTLARPSGARCEECGSTFNLRLCAHCGHVGCCDSSPNRHATAHHRASGHAVVQSFEPCEDWFWCYVDELAFRMNRVS